MRKILIIIFMISLTMILSAEQNEPNSWAQDSTESIKDSTIITDSSNPVTEESTYSENEINEVVINNTENTFQNNSIEIGQIFEDKSMSMADVLKKYNNSDNVILEINKVSETYDYDNDGLLDYYEIYRNFTDPNNPDTDGDGILDGNWEERKEYTYVVESELRLIQPYDLEFMQNHIYQDIKIIEETDEYADIILMIYPYNYFDKTVIGNPNWKTDNLVLMKDIKPGRRNDWDVQMQKDLLELLLINNINPDELTDLELIIKVVQLFECGDIASYANFEKINYDGFHMYDWFIDFLDDGSYQINQKVIDNNLQTKKEIEDTIFQVKINLEESTGEIWSDERILSIIASSKAQFYERMHGSCTGTSEFYANIFQALGIPSKVLPYATFVDSRNHNEELTQYRIEQGEVFVDEKVKEAWNHVLTETNGGSNHVTNLIYIGNRWINVDIAGGMKLNYSSFDAKRLVFQKTADYDFADTLIEITETWLLMDDDLRTSLNESKNFDSLANEEENNFPNFSLKLYNIYDNYGKHISDKIVNYIDSFDLREYQTDLWIKEYNAIDTADKFNERRVFKEDEKEEEQIVSNRVFAFDNGAGDNLAVLIDTNYSTEQIDKFAIYNYLIEDPDLYLVGDNLVFISGNINYNNLPEKIKNKITADIYNSLEKNSEPIDLRFEDDLRVIIMK